VPSLYIYLYMVRQGGRWNLNASRTGYNIVVNASRRLV
jgi:hypothetical protein